MNSIKFLVVLFSIVFIGGCVYPTSNVTQSDSRPTLVFTTDNKDAVVYVDGLNVGSAIEYRGKPYALSVEEGAHKVKVVIGETTVLEQTIFLSEGQKKVLDLTN